MIKTRTRSMKSVAVLAIGFLIASASTTAAFAGGGSGHVDISYCHATGSDDGNPYVSLTTDVESFYANGHIDHQNHGDIYPAGSVKIDDQEFSWTAQGDQSLLGTNCKVKPADIVVPGEWIDGQYECDATEVAITREVSTTTYVFSEKKGKWVAQDPGITVENSTRELTEEEQAANVCPPEQPEDIVIVGDWTDGQYECDATEVATTRETSTTTYVYSEEDGEWVAQDPGITVENSTRELTEEEQAANVCPPGQPEDIVIVGDWTDGQYECDATEVATTRETSTTTYVYDEELGEWVAQTPVITVENSTRELTEEEQAANVCPVEITDTAVTPEPPTVVAKCLPNNDTVTLPATVGVIYTAGEWFGGKLTVTAAAAEGYTLIGDATWIFTDVPSAACPDEPPAFSFVPTAQLAQTGTSDGTLGLAVLAMLLISTGAVLVSRKVRA